MNSALPPDETTRLLELAAELAIAGRKANRPLDPHCVGLPEEFALNVPLSRRGRDPRDVIEALDAAARPGLSGMTEPGFLSWVIGGSHPAGVAADWLAASWGQNACIYDASPASGEAEAVSARWLLDLLDLPREASVGFATGATMAAFTCLAAARLCVLERAGHDFETKGLFGCPEVAVYIADDAHVTNYSVLRYLGFGNDQLRRIPSINNGTYDLDALEARMADDSSEARIVIAQAGHIMSGAFDNFTRLSQLCHRHGAWLHVDGAFGLWARASNRLRVLAHNVDLADSWSVDGHKWLQIPYDLGFAIVRHENYHRSAMAMQAGYLPEPSANRNNADYVPELSRRARGFSVWAVMQSLGRQGIEDLVERSCHATHLLSCALRRMDGIEVLNTVCLNQLAVCFESEVGDAAQAVADHINAGGRYFVRTAKWQGRMVLRFSISNGATTIEHIDGLIAEIKAVWQTFNKAAA